jgi:hypothetical protein
MTKVGKMVESFIIELRIALYRAMIGCSDDDGEQPVEKIYRERYEVKRDA